LEAIDYLKKAMKVNLPEPCHEDWNKMDSQEKGRFCGSCQKLVIDFSVMSDTEIINYFKEYKSQNTCGHFKKSQVDRKLKEQETPRRKLFLKELAAACFAFFVASTDAKAQATGAIAFTDEEIAEIKQQREERKAIENQGKEVAINGKIVNGKEVLSNAIISIKGTEHTTVSLENGLFSIHIPNEVAQNQEFITLVVEYGDLGSKEVEVTTSPTNQFIEIDFEENKLAPEYTAMMKSTITGTITDYEGALAGATVQVKGTNHGTTTDIEGNYSLVVPEGEVTLVYRFVGFESVEETIGARTVIDVKLESGELQGGAMFYYTYKWYSPKGLWYKIKNIFR
jgi:hypothetical protein